MTGAKSALLYGRIEELVDEDKKGAPELRLHDAIFVKSEDGPQSVSPNKSFSGKVIEEYPDLFPLHWGGHISLTKNSEADKSFVPGLSGNIRFDFRRGKTGLMLSPPVSLFWVPLRNCKEGSVAEARLTQGKTAYLWVDKKEGLRWSGMSYELNIKNLDKPLIAVIQNLGLTGKVRNNLYTGDKVKVRKLQNNLRQLDPQTFEQDTVASYTAKSFGLRYCEEVIRLRLARDNKLMSVNIVELMFNSDGTFRSEKDYQGTITAGENVDTADRGYAVLSSPASEEHHLFGVF